MRRHHHRRSPLQRAVAERIQVDEIRRVLLLQIEQPVARFLDIPPGIVHPLQLEVAREQLEIRDARGLLPLRRPRRAAQRGQNDVDPMRPERLGQLHRVGPNAADGVARHEDALDHRFELHQAAPALFLNIAELVEAAQVNRARAPRRDRRARPSARVVGRAG